MSKENLANAEDLSAEENESREPEGLLSSLVAGIDTAFPLSGGEPDVVLIDLEVPDTEGNEGKIAAFLHNLDTAFPLSGGEEEIEFLEFELPEIDITGDSDQPKEHHSGHSFLDDIDTAFPLSGGEQ